MEIKTEVSTQRISDTLCNAFEGGSNYWYRIEKFTKPVNFNNTPADEQRFKHLSYPLNEGGSLLISDANEAGEEDKRTEILNLETIQKGVQLMASLHPRHFSDMVNDNDDATTGDVLLQLCLFGEVIYG